MTKYNPAKIEKKLQKKWYDSDLYRAGSLQAKSSQLKHKSYVLIEFAYPSGSGLHMGHLRPYVAADVYSRYMRMKGFDVMYPMGWDAFGLPAENFAIKHGVHPSKSTTDNIKNSKRQTQEWGISFDWSREVTTTDPKYYKWTQWIFLQLFKAGLAYESDGEINWCPKDKTGLANEEVINGNCERCGTQVERRKLRQWYLKITDYAESLIDGLKDLDWPDSVKTQQINWIGKSEGAEIEFPLAQNEKITYVLLHGYTGSPQKHMFPWLKKELEKTGTNVIVPELPNSDDPNVEEQVNFVLKSVKFTENTVLVGHSLGGAIALKVLEKLTKPIDSTFLVASYIENNFLNNEPFEEEAFDWKFDFEKIKRNAGVVTILRDVTDEIVPIESAVKISRAIGGRIIDINGSIPHCWGKKEPEVLNNINPVNITSSVKIFTTRPDTLFGATFLVISPEVAKNWLDVGWNATDEVKRYVTDALNKSERERTENKEKTGVDTGVKAINLATKLEIPVWVADYVLGSYGTGAIMAVPAHDARDYEFAEKFGLKKIKVIEPPPIATMSRNAEDIAAGANTSLRIESDLYDGEGTLVNSGKFNGMESDEAKEAITKEVAGEKQIQYKLRDWLFSRQRYWGEPIPIIHCESCGIVPVPEDQLPVLLPEVEKHEPTGTGESPLAAIEDWVNVKCPKCGSDAKRETNTMPQWAGSSWYYLRYADPNNDKELAGQDKMKHWLPVDVYFGGMEHTTLHLLYSRFWHQFLYDQKIVPTPEPYTKRVPHGIVLGPDGEKMSKSRGNVVNPDDLVKKYGADTVRMYELFLGPHEDTVAWQEGGIVGVYRFINRVWNLANNFKEKENDGPTIDKSIKKIAEYIENFRFNTTVSELMILLNSLESEGSSKNNLESFLKILAPLAPHITEEIWHEVLGHKDSIHQQEWPEYDENNLLADEVDIVVQVNGKVRDMITMPIDSSEETIKEKALESEKVKKSLGDSPINKTIFLKNRLINFVVID